MLGKTLKEQQHSDTERSRTRNILNYSFVVGLLAGALVLLLSLFSLDLINKKTVDTNNDTTNEQNDTVSQLANENGNYSGGTCEYIQMFYPI